MSIAAASLEYRQALDDFTRSKRKTRVQALWDLENRLEELILRGIKRYDGPWPEELTPADKAVLDRVSRAKSRRAQTYMLLDAIFGILPQPTNFAEYTLCFNCGKGLTKWQTTFCSRMCESTFVKWL